MKINMQRWAEDIIAAKDVKILPILFFPCLEGNGKKIIEVVNNSQAQFENMKGIIDKYPKMIGAMTGMDLTTEAETFGCDVHFSEIEAPRTINEIVKDRESAESLKIPSIESGRGTIFVKAAELASKDITDRPTFGGMLGPFSLAAVLMGLETTLKSLKKDPDTVKILLDKCTEYLINYAKAFKEAGANGILLAEPTAGLLSPKQCEEFSSYYVKKIVDAVQDEYFFVVLHNCGQTKKMVESMLGTGAKGYHFGNAVDMVDIISQIPPRVLVFGNIDPSRVLSHGSTELVKTETLNLLEKMKPYPHFILSSGCDLPPGVPIENLDAFFQALEEFNKSNH
ncbi:uroporphyrinogen decarboxylase family protein [Pseudobacteroides cellulosolvens]|uniref:Uroporphyrinogen decarboxylase (URO-D) n=1 Tax=Pseudobacteroides cellulosolvens ATCC 35603 = DSM 2933 TaxID=398512 RepID=A0A0L6JQC1_9FIRM|nr:uroporphyrinogen decarboxylase family protein [Pseudobacteroides cellulosolvens]KNY27988.1 Uroporphyrinogen decarboxylase (URO-D) [Pseudobacteroides cellulosolvens ATCC 35603 = DSM 2933]